VKRWALAGGPRGLALAPDGTLYVGLFERQAVVAIDPRVGRVVREAVLDSPEIASTKELVTLRLDPAGTRLAVAHGSDESASILALPSLKTEREILLEGETVRDALFDPKGRYLYLLGRTVHVFDSAGQRDIRSLGDIAPMAIATDRQGRWLAIAGSEEFENGPATVVAIYDAETLREIARDPLQTDRSVEALFFAAGDRTLVALSRDRFAEKPVTARKAPAYTTAEGQMRVQFAFGDFVNTERICLPDASGPQIGALTANGKTLVFAEKRCSASGGMTGSPRIVVTTSLYGIDAWAVAIDAENDLVYATDPSGYLTGYEIPAPSARSARDRKETRNR
jgi:hypothetical protein